MNCTSTINKIKILLFLIPAKIMESVTLIGKAAINDSLYTTQLVVETTYIKVSLVSIAIPLGVTIIATVDT